MNFFHPFHLVSVSPWPILASIQVFNLVFSMGDLFNYSMEMEMTILNLLILLIIKFQWWRDITRESCFEGLHTKEVYMGLKMGMILFICSEIFFFVSFFWSFFHSSLSPDIFMGFQWPPKGVLSFNPMGIPLLNTMILLSSGVTITWTHHSIMEGLKIPMIESMFLTLCLGFYFLIMQMIEYSSSSFSIADSVYGSTFFMLTGFHGLHVFIGATFLLVIFLRMKTNQFSSFHHFGFEASAWYWHFVDVVWLYLYLFIYWWKF